MAIKLKSGSLETRLTVAMLLLTILPVMAVGWMAHNIMFEHIRSENMKIVGRVADSKRDQLIMVLTRANNRAKSFLSNLVAQCGDNATKLNRSCASNLTKSYLTTENASGAVIRLQRGGQSLTIGTPAVREEVRLQAGQIARFSGIGPGNNLSYFISAADPAGFELLITYPSSTLDPVFSVLPEELGTSGETFLADSEGYFVTQPKYRSTQGHTHPISARPMLSCLGGQSREVVDPDYRDVPTVMGFRFIPEFGAACIMAHIGEEEAFAALNLLEKRLIISMFVFGVILITITVYFARNIVRPVTNLTKVARAIATGDYTARADAAGNDEISELAASFNFMTSRLYQQSAHLEDLVRERTCELNASNEQLQRSERSLNEAQRIARLGSWDLDLVKNVLTWSDEIYRIFEIDPEKFGASYDAFLNTIHPDDRALVDNTYVESVKNKKPYDIVHRLLMKDGRVKYVNELGETYYGEDGKPLRSFGIVHDITESKRAEAQIAESLSLLQATNKALDEFAYIAAHDLKEPLRGIHNYISFFREDYGDQLDDNARQYINSIQRLAERLAGLIDSLLAYSRLGSTELAKGRVNVDAVVGAVTEDLSRFWRDTSLGGMGIELRAHGPLGTVQGDATRIGEVFQNLISNAAKYNDKPSKWIEIGCDRSGATPVFYVRDNGIGIQPHHQESVFRIFKRLHEQNKYGGGTGAGLTIAKKIIERHGGRIWLESTPGEGTTFYFTLSEDA